MKGQLKMKTKILSTIFLLTLILSCGTNKDPFASNNDLFLKAAKNGELANESFKRCRHFVSGWLNHADPETGLIPRNLNKDKDIWNARDSAADNYPFMVLTAAITDFDLFTGRMREMLETEIRLTSRLGNLPDTYSFSKKGFRHEKVNIDRLIFGGSEYVKDGLLPLTEWLGSSPWSERMIGIVDDIWKYAPYSTKYGKIPAESDEVNGEMLQVLSRLYWMTGNENYLNYAFRLADYYLIDHHPIVEGKRLKLRDHGCEITSGLSEVYAAAHFVDPQKKQSWQKPIHELFDCVLEVGRNEHGMLYNWVNLQTGEHDEKLCDTWGYNYNGFYTIYLIDGTEKYHEAVIHVLSNLNDNYRDYDWENDSSDGYADAIESALNLYNREPNISTAEWIDHQTQIMWSKQQADGVIEGWHGDGNFARTSIMYALWKTKGVTIVPWRQDVVFGADCEDGKLYISIKAKNSWQGKIKFDAQRHKTNLHLPIDYPRINQFPEWFTVGSEKNYQIQINDQTGSRTISGRELVDGLEIALEPNKEMRIIVK